MSKLHKTESIPATIDDIMVHISEDDVESQIYG